MATRQTVHRRVDIERQVEGEVASTINGGARGRWGGQAGVDKSTTASPPFYAYHLPVIGGQTFHITPLR